MNSAPISMSLLLLSLLLQIYEIVVLPKVVKDGFVCINFSSNDLAIPADL